MDQHVLAIEAGGTKFELARFGDDPVHPEARARIETRDPASTCAALARAIDRLCANAPAAVGLASFGPIDRATGRLGATPKPGWSGFDLGEAVFAAAHRAPLAIETDVGAAALGEAHHGAGRAHRALVYLTVGTGIGGALCLDGELAPGPFHPEMGHVAIRPSGPRFAGVCPFHGDCLEGRCSGVALARRWGAPAESLRDDHEAWGIWASELADGIATLALVTGCERLVLGGGVASRPAARELLVEALAATDGGYLPDRPVARRRLVVAPGLGDESALVGAARRARALLGAAQQ